MTSVTDGTPLHEVKKGRLAVLRTQQWRYTPAVGRQVTRDHPHNLWHRCESIINDAAVTRCGRVMAPKNGNGWRLLWRDEYLPGSGLTDPFACQHCYPRETRHAQ